MDGTPLGGSVADSMVPCPGCTFLLRACDLHSGTALRSTSKQMLPVHLQEAPAAAGIAADLPQSSTKISMLLRVRRLASCTCVSCSRHALAMRL